jgi:hypothetical protein
MKNITKFEKFKKLNEAAPVKDVGGYGGGGETYGANVKGNFAGAENTLIGSAVINIFSFFKRKINEGILYLYSKSLFREYLANVLRYSNKHGIKYRDSVTIYNVEQIKDLSGNSLESKVKLKVNFVNEDESLLTTFVKSSKVIDTTTKDVVVDGTYKILNDTVTFVVKDGIIGSIEKIETKDVKPLIDKEEKIETKDDTEIQTEEKPKYEVGDDIKDIIKDIEKISKNIDNVSSGEQKEVLGKKLKIIRSIKGNITQYGINDINTILTKGNLPISKKDELNYYLKVYNKEIEILNNLETVISNSIKGKKQTPKTEVVEKPVVKKEKEEKVTATVESNNFLNESFRGVKLRGVDKKLADEVGDLDLSILEDEKFAQKFETEEVKKGVTDLVKENENPIIKIQLAAERIYGLGDKTPGKDKLENTWKKMIADVKGSFSRYMLTDQVDPIVLTKNSSSTESLKEKSKTDVNDIGRGTVAAANSFMMSENKILNLANGFSNELGTCGIMSTNLGDFIYLQDYVTLNGKKYWGYKILGTANVSELSKVKEESEIENHISYNKKELIEKFNLKEKLKYTAPDREVIGEYDCTYIISTSEKNKLSTPKVNSGFVTNNVNVVSLYVDKSKYEGGVVELNEKDYLVKNFLVLKNNEKKSVILTSIKSSEQYKVKIGVSLVNRIAPKNEAKFNITEDMKKPDPSDLENIKEVNNLRIQIKK